MLIRPKNEVAEDLIHWHFQVDAGIKEIYRIISANEDARDEPIKLLEVDDDASETGYVDAFCFDPAGDITYPSVVAPVTSRELELIKLGALELPESWNLKTAIFYPRAATSMPTGKA
jgi:hypothetical protein